MAITSNYNHPTTSWTINLGHPDDFLNWLQQNVPPEEVSLYLEAHSLSESLNNAAVSNGILVVTVQDVDNYIVTTTCNDIPAFMALPESTAFLAHSKAADYRKKRHEYYSGTVDGSLVGID